jgi:H+/Cl- antiporter ClcA
VVAKAVGLGAFAGVFGVAYLLLIEALTERLWGEDWAGEGWFSGDIWSFLIPVVAAVLVGLTYKVFHLPARYPGFIDELEEGEVEPTTAPGAIGIAVLSLVGGASLGPEAPLGTAGGAAGTWLARRTGGSTDEVRQMSFVGISGAFGGLTSTPVGGPLLAFELEHDQTHSYYFTNLVPGMISGAVAFGIMWPIVGAPFQGLVTIPKGDFHSWMLLAAVGLGVIGGIAALAVGKLMVLLVGLMRPLDSRPLLRAVVGGMAVGAVGFTLPLTLFSGQTSLPVVVAEFDSLGICMLLALAVLKTATLGVSLGAGFYGGPIFPMFFIGAVLGVAVHVLMPSIPLALAVGAVMAALGAATALAPLSMSILVAIMMQSGLELFGAVVLAAATAYAIRVVFSPPSSMSDMKLAASGEPARSSAI